MVGNSISGSCRIFACNVDVLSLGCTNILIPILALYELRLVSNE